MACGGSWPRMGSSPVTVTKERPGSRSPAAPLCRRWPASQKAACPVVGRPVRASLQDQNRNRGVPVPSLGPTYCSLLCDWQGAVLESSTRHHCLSICVLSADEEGVLS